MERSSYQLTRHQQLLLRRGWALSGPQRPWQEALVVVRRCLWTAAYCHYLCGALVLELLIWASASETTPGDGQRKSRPQRVIPRYSHEARHAGDPPREPGGVCQGGTVTLLRAYGLVHPQIWKTWDTGCKSCPPWTAHVISVTSKAYFPL